MFRKVEHDEVKVSRTYAFCTEKGIRYGHSEFDPHSNTIGIFDDLGVCHPLEKLTDLWEYSSFSLDEQCTNQELDALPLALIKAEIEITESDIQKNWSEQLVKSEQLRQLQFEVTQIASYRERLLVRYFEMMEGMVDIVQEHTRDLKKHVDNSIKNALNWMNELPGG